MTEPWHRMRYELEIMVGPRAGQTQTIEETMTVGRSRDNSLSLSDAEDPQISLEHAVLFLKGGKLFIRDQVSSNGTFVDDRRVEEAELGNGCAVSLGPNGPHFRIHCPSGADRQAVMPGKLSRPLSRSMSTRPGAVSIRQSAGLGPDDASGLGADTSLNLSQSTLRSMEHGEFSPSLLGRMLASESQRGKVKSALGRRRIRQGRLAKAIAALLVLAVVSALWLFYQNLRYKELLRAQSGMAERIRDLESQLEAKEGTGPDSAKSALVARLRAYERKYMGLNIRNRDRIAFYADGLGYRISMALVAFGNQNYLVPEIFIRQVKAHIQAFDGPLRKSVRSAFHRDPSLRGMIERELAAANVPKAFFYLAVNESMLNPLALSPAGARGIWQLMPATARAYGLKVPENWKSVPPTLDSRTDPVASTRAAVRHLKDLLQQMGDVALVMASYNAGEPKVRRALSMIDDPVNNRDFWYIYRMGYLTGETNEYIPKIVALMLLDQEKNAQ